VYAAYRQIYAALKFLYTVTLKLSWVVERIPFPKRQHRPLPVVLHPEKLVRLFQVVRRPKYRTLFMTCYASGLRVDEACLFRIADINSKQKLLHISHAKGGQERVTLLSAKLLDVLRDYWRIEKPRLWPFPGSTPAEPLASASACSALRQAGLDAGLNKPCTWTARLVEQCATRAVGFTSGEVRGLF
jgi:integrase